ncbi:hypothetical protein SALBM217S_03175 [Streptomyces griseoloalbus]
MVRVRQEAQRGVPALDRGRRRPLLGRLGGAATGSCGARASTRWAAAWRAGSDCHRADDPVVTGRHGSPCSDKGTFLRSRRSFGRAAVRVRADRGTSGPSTGAGGDVQRHRCRRTRPTGSRSRAGDLRPPGRAVLHMAQQHPVAHSSGDPALEDSTGRVVAVDPPRHLSFTWEEDEIHFDLEELGEKRTRFTLTNAPGAENTAARNSAGWDVCLSALDAWARGERFEGPHAGPDAPAPGAVRGLRRGRGALQGRRTRARTTDSRPLRPAAAAPARAAAPACRRAAQRACHASPPSSPPPGPRPAPSTDGGR